MASRLYRRGSHETAKAYNYRYPPYSKATDLDPIVLRDVEERGRDIEGCIKQWFAFVKPNFERYVEPQRKVAGLYAILR